MGTYTVTVVVLLLQTFVLSLYYTSALSHKYRKIISFLGFSIAQISFVILEWFTFINILYIKIPLALLWIYGATGIFSTSSRRQRIQTTVALALCDFLSDFLTLGLFYTMQHACYTNFYEVTEQRILALIFHPIFLFSLTTIFLTFWKHTEPQIRRRLIFLMLLMPITEIALLMGIYNFNRSYLQEQLLVYSAICTVLIVSMNYYVYRTIQESAAAMAQKKELEHLKSQREMDYKYYQLVKSNAERISSIRHDLKNQLQLAYAISVAEPEKMQSLLDGLNDKLSTLSTVIYCKNTVVNTILCLKASEAQEYDIDFSVKVDITDWHLSENDMSSLFFNLLDNAIEACKNNTGKKNFISVKAGTVRGFHIVKIMNTCAPRPPLPPDTLPASSKSDAERHGYGLKIIKSIAEKQNGSLLLFYENGLFTAQVTIPETPAGSENS